MASTLKRRMCGFDCRHPADSLYSETFRIEKPDDYSTPECREPRGNGTVDAFKRPVSVPTRTEPSALALRNLGHTLSFAPCSNASP
jgi:hypothetical protein